MSKLVIVVLALFVVGVFVVVERGEKARSEREERERRVNDDIAFSREMSKRKKERQSTPKTEERIAKPPAATYTTNDVDYKLAVIDGSYFPKLDPKYAVKVRPYRVILDRLDRKCKESRTQIGDMTVTVQKEFLKKGYDYSLLKILILADESIPEEASGIMSYSEVVALLVVLSE